MARSQWVGLLLLIAYLGNYFASGQSTSGDCNNDEHDFQKYFSDALVLLTRTIQLEFHNLKVQMQLENMAIKNELYRECQKPSSRHCPIGFNYSVAGFSKCYAILNGKVNWKTAQERCKGLHRNAQLAVINSSREVLITTEIVRNTSCVQTNRLPDNTENTANGFWIGARRRNISDCTSPVEWTRDSRMTFPIDLQSSFWAPGEPNCGFGSEGCASINKWHNSQWNDLICAWSLCPLCEVDINT